MAMSEEASTPTFAVWALKDPYCGKLDGIQIVKGFISKWGLPDEKVYDVVWSGQQTRQPDEATGKLPPVRKTVDVAKATYTNDIGATQLRATWTDPDFDPGQKELCYVRVLEIPTPRWSTYDAAASGGDPPAGLDSTLQERAWPSLILPPPPCEILLEEHLQRMTDQSWSVTIHNE